MKSFRNMTSPHAFASRDSMLYNNERSKCKAIFAIQAQGRELQMEDQSLAKAYDALSLLIDQYPGNFDSLHAEFSLNQEIGGCVSIKIAKNSIILNLFFDEYSFPEENFEEAYISYKVNDVVNISNSTIYRMAKILNKVMSL